MTQPTITSARSTAPRAVFLPGFLVEWVDRIAAETARETMTDFETCRKLVLHTALQRGLTALEDSDKAGT